jgi:hypothetical protein
MTPTADNISRHTSMNTSVQITLTGTSNIPNDVLKFSLVTSPEHGVTMCAVTPPEPNIVTYKPNPGFTGEDSFSYKATSTTGLGSPPSNVTIDVRAVHQARNGLIELGIQIVVIVVVFIAIQTAFSKLVSVSFIMFYCMAATIIIVLTVPLSFKLEHWTGRKKQKPKPMDLLQIDATVIAGILIFLTINASTNQHAGLPERALIAAFTTLTIIPFALSSIIVLIWGNNTVWLSTKKERKKVKESKTNDDDETETKPWFFPSGEKMSWLVKNRIALHKVTGVKLGVVSMMGGFTWIIISMIIIVVIIVPTPPTITSVYPSDKSSVANSSTIITTFSEPMLNTTINKNTFTVKDLENHNVTGTVTLTPDGLTAAFTPSRGLNNNTTYAATITKAVMDEAGNHMLSDKTWSFTICPNTPGRCR